MLRITLDTQIEDLEQHFETAHWNYLNNTDQRTTEFKNLTHKDQELSKEIEQKIRKIDRLQSQLQHWKMKIAQNLKECNERNSNLKEEKDGIQKHFQNLKSRMNRFRSTQKDRLSELTKNANEAKNLLKDKCERGERILKLSEVRRGEERSDELNWRIYGISSLRLDASVSNVAATSFPNFSKHNLSLIHVTRFARCSWAASSRPRAKRSPLSTSQASRRR